MFIRSSKHFREQHAGNSVAAHTCSSPHCVCHWLITTNFNDRVVVLIIAIGKVNMRMNRVQLHQLLLVRQSRARD